MSFQNPVMKLNTTSTMKYTSMSVSNQNSGPYAGVEPHAVRRDPGEVKEHKDLNDVPAAELPVRLM